jgi:hypothetical protein
MSKSGDMYLDDTRGMGGSWLANHKMPAVLSLDNKKNETIIGCVAFMVHGIKRL